MKSVAVNLGTQENLLNKWISDQLSTHNRTNKKDDCYFLNEFNHFHSTIQCCDREDEFLDCKCEECKFYISREDARNVIEKYVLTRE